MSNHKARTLQKYDVYYVIGGNTKVRVIRPHISKTKHNGDRSEVRVLQATITSDYYEDIGELVIINNQVLYPRKNPRFANKIVKKWDGIIR